MPKETIEKAPFVFDLNLYNINENFRYIIL